MADVILDTRALRPADAVDKYYTALGEMFGAAQVQRSHIATNASDSYQTYANNQPASKSRESEQTKKLIELFTPRDYLRLVLISSTIMVGGNPILFEYKSEDDIVATLKFSPQNNQTGQQIVATSSDEWVAKLSKVFTLQRKADLVGEHLPVHEQEKLRFQQQAVNDLTAALLKLEDIATRQISNQVDFFAKKSVELDEQQSHRDEQRRKDYEAKLSQLDAERAALAKEKEELDVRRATIARRALLTDLGKVLGEDFKIKEDTAKLRNTNHKLCILGLATGLILVAIGAYELLIATKLDWHHWSVFIAGMILFSTTLIYYLKWSNAWFLQLAHAEFAKRKLKIDILRSSWVAEMALEWSEDKGAKEFPKELLTAFTSDLFVPEVAKDQEYHPVGQIVNALGAMENISITKDGVKFSRKEK